MKILKWLFSGLSTDKGSAGHLNKDDSSSVKEFKTRVVYAHHGKYYVDYSYDYKTNWKRIVYWFGFDTMHPSSGLEGFFEDLLDIEKAEELAKSLKSIDDLNEYYKPILEEKRKWEADEKEFWEKKVPHKEKIFK